MAKERFYLYPSKDGVIARINSTHILFLVDWLLDTASWFTKYHVYVLSDEPIEPKDYIFDTIQPNLMEFTEKATPRFFEIFGDSKDFQGWKKIVATTNPRYALPTFPKDLLNRVVENKIEYIIF